MRAYNSTIRVKKKICKSCGREDFIFSRGRCARCAKIEDVLNAVEEEGSRIIEEEWLSDLIQRADEVYSTWLRMSSADENGYVSCYTCDRVMRWQAAQCGHYIKRGNLLLRHDPRNTRVQGKCCNEYKGGNYLEFTKRLEAEHPGITDILTEESVVVYKPTRQEINGIITEYNRKIKLLKQ